MRNLKSQFLAAAFGVTATTLSFVATLPTFAETGAVRTPKVTSLDIKYDAMNIDGLNIAYPVWQKFPHDQHPKTIIFWGQHDPFFTPEGGEAYLRDLPNAEMYRLNAGHFAAEDNAPFIAERMKAFYDKEFKSAM